MQHYQTQSPVLFLIFNRPDVTAQVFNKIKQVKPGKLYVAADGPRADKKSEAELCEQARAVIKQIDWECELKTLYRKENLGCKIAVSSAIDWFFDQEEEGIVFEDDCLPDISFFKFCDELLQRYRFDTRIRHITGNNFNNGRKWGDDTYYFSNQTTVWGWASWKRVWLDYDVNLAKYKAGEAAEQMAKIFADEHVVEAWAEIFADMKAGKIDTWDYQLSFANYFNNGLSIIPNYNLVTNIGFGENATHTFDKQHPLADIPLVAVDEISHPKYILPEKQADLLFLREYFRVAERITRLKKHNSLKRRIKRLFRNN